MTSVYHALGKLQAPTVADTVEVPVPAVSVRSSVKPNSISCLECGAVQRALKRHLGTSHALTPEQYRAKWRLPADYPMTAPNSSAERSRASKARGFGRKR
ncbi:MucR family transcriptional regulator [Sphingomonas sp. MMS24-J45]|uniref:MucR family transcriptional regulator n=1 Tax=Sphingomonas sp. MMS24-J45 TaxID=3238806 RepID=UPI00384D9BF7